MNAFSYAGAGVGALGVLLAIGSLFASGDDRSGLLVAGISLIPFGLIFFVVGKRIGKFGGVRPGLLETGLPRRGLVKRMWETGVTLNNNPVLGFDVEVVSERDQPYQASVQQAIPRMLVGAILPGAVLGIEVDPEDKQRIAIDWSIAPEVPGGTGAAAPDTDDVPDALAGRNVSIADLLARGRRTRATIASMRRMGTLGDLGLTDRSDDRWDDELFLMELEVRRAGLDPITARVLHRVPDHLVGRVGPGLEVPVAVDRDHPEREVAIDWDAVVAPGSGS